MLNSRSAHERAASSPRTKEVDMLRRITSHVPSPIRAIPGDLRDLSEEYDARSALAGAIDCVGFGLVLLAQGGRILFANGMARNVMQKGAGLRSCSEWLKLPNADLAMELQNLLTGTDRGEASGTAMILDGDASNPPLLVQLMPLLRSSEQASAGRDHPVAVLLILDLEHHTAVNFRAFAARHGLTDAETRMLRQILGGKGVVASAAKLRVSETTARTHMQRIFEKTGTNRQTELICVFFGRRLQ
jgi:DNA-binding CsgD family transcriptional regulator